MLPTNHNDSILCNTCYIFTYFLKCFNKNYLKTINIKSFYSIFYKINKLKTYKNFDNLYDTVLYLYNEDYEFKKEINKNMNIVCKKYNCIDYSNIVYL